MTSKVGHSFRWIRETGETYQGIWALTPVAFGRIHTFSHSSRTLHTFYFPNSVPGAGDALVTRTQMIPALQELAPPFYYDQSFSLSFFFYILSSSRQRGGCAQCCLYIHPYLLLQTFRYSLIRIVKETISLLTLYVFSYSCHWNLDSVFSDLQLYLRLQFSAWYPVGVFRMLIPPLPPPLVLHSHLSSNDTELDGSSVYVVNTLFICLFFSNLHT